MAGALLVIPLAAMVVPIALILLAVLVDVLFVGFTVFRLWHDEYAVRVGDYVGNHFIRPFRRLAHPHHPVA